MDAADCLELEKEAPKANMTSDEWRKEHNITIKSSGTQAFEIPDPILNWEVRRKEDGRGGLVFATHHLTTHLITQPFAVLPLRRTTEPFPHLRWFPSPHRHPVSILAHHNFS